MSITVNRTLYDWALERSGRRLETLPKRLSKLPQWQEGTKHPTLKQLEAFAKCTHVPIGSFFSDVPPDETLPVKDFRTFANEDMIRISGNVLDTIYDCQLKQAWYEDYCLMHGEDKHTFVGSCTINDDVKYVATAITDRFFSKRERYSSWDEAFSKRKEHIEAQGILVMSSGVALGNPHRPLDLHEFRGFALSNDYAPLIFINAKDTTAARSFTLIHELAHIALGESGISNDEYHHDIERWCNAVASEVLVPEATLTKDYTGDNTIENAIQALAKAYKVSTLVILRRLRDTQLLNMSDEAYWDIYNDEKERALQTHGNQNSRGGNYYNSKRVALSKRFLRALAVSTLEGHTLYRDAMHLVNAKKMSTFQRLIIDNIRKPSS